MGNYGDFLRIHTKEKARLRRLYWVHGEEDLLRHLTLRKVKDMAEVPAHNIMHVSASDTSEAEVWAHLNQHALDSNHARLLVVHDAQKLTAFDQLQSWIKSRQVTRSRSAVAVFVSTEKDSPEAISEIVGRSSNAMVVKCTLPKDEEDRLKRTKEIIMRWGDIDAIPARILAQHVNYDLCEAYAVVQKAALFPEARLTARAVELLAPKKADNDLIMALLAVNRRRAVEALPDVPVQTVGRIIGSLSTHVEALSRINSTLTSGLTMRDTARRLQMKEGYIRLLHPYAKSYPRKQAVRRILLLNRADAAWQSGAREGVLETLIAQW